MTNPNDPASRFTKREEMAKAAMQGLLSDPTDHEDECQFHTEDCIGENGTHFVRTVFDETCSQAVARLSVQHADDLIARLNATKP